MQARVVHPFARRHQLRGCLAERAENTACDPATSWHPCFPFDLRGHSLMVKLQPSKLAMRVRFSLPACDQVPEPIGVEPTISKKAKVRITTLSIGIARRSFWHVINWCFYQISADIQNVPSPENLSLEKLSPELMTWVSEALAYTVIPLCPDGQQLGSGVLVEVDGVSGILTAEHVIFDERFQRATGLWTTPHLHSEEARDKPTTHFTSTNIQMDLLRCYPETPQLA